MSGTVTAGCLGGACALCPGASNAGKACACSCHSSGTTLTDFLLARIAEDEENLPNFSSVTPDDFLDESATTRWGERVAADCEAKRRIVALHQCIDDSSAYAGVPLYCDPCQAVDGYGGDSIGDRGIWPCDTLKALALPYADHPHYREEWKP